MFYANHISNTDMYHEDINPLNANPTQWPQTILWNWRLKG